MKIAISSAGALLGLALASSCAGQAPTTPVPAASRPDDGQATLEQIRRLVGPASCRASAECQSLALGSSPCGGPEAYLPWSSGQTPPKELAALAQRYRQQRAAYHQALGMQSDCRAPRDPGSSCERRPLNENGTCVAPAAN
ncbi:MAG: hypothetical protein V4508_14535 [Pseudomonadota bacterium]